MEIQGLNARQRKIADTLWAMDDMDAIVAWFKTLPRSHVRDAYVVYHMMVWAMWDDAVLESDLAEAQELIDHIRSL